MDTPLSDETKLKIVLTTSHAKVPTRKTDMAAGMDLYSTETMILPPGETKLFDTHLRIECPPLFFLKIEEKSSLAYFESIGVRAGIIDSDYRGTIKILLENFGKCEKKINIGQAIAQIIMLPYIKPKLKIARSLSKTNRGHSGFGIEHSFHRCSLNTSDVD